MIAMQQVTSLDTAEACNVIMDALMLANVDRSTAVCGLLGVLAIQINGAMPDTDTLMQFVSDGSQWATLYLMDLGKVKQ